jgi:hypothetical protein
MCVEPDGAAKGIINNFSRLDIIKNTNSFAADTLILL